MNRLGRLHSLTDQIRKLSGGPSTPAHPSSDAHGWLARRGEIRASLECDVIGNFPGFHQSAALIVGARTLVTTRYLIVDEGERHGFAQPISAITDVSLDDRPHVGPDLIVRYRQGGETGWFRLRETRGRLRRKGPKGIETLRDALRDGNVSFGNATAAFNSYLLVPWDAAGSLESDRVVWSGRATAPIRATLECAPTDVWVTAASLVWGSNKGEGVNRLPLTAIRSFSTLTLADPGSTPSVFVSTFGPDNIPVSLPFIFDSGADRVADYHEFVELFSPSLVTEIDAVPPLQPWNDPESTEVDEEADVWDEQADESTSEEADDMTDSHVDEPDVETEAAPSWETWASARPPSRFGVDSAASSTRVTGGTSAESMGFDSSSMRLTEALAGWPSATDASSEPDEMPEEQAPTEPSAIPAYLATARRAIAEVNEVIDRRMAGNSAPSPSVMPPSAEDQAAALAELVELASSGYYDAEGTRSVKAQITRFGEAAIRLRSLLELCNAGHMTIKDVGAKRDAIVGGLPVSEHD